MVGVTGFEPVTLRLSSACSNQLSYTPLVSKLRVTMVFSPFLAERFFPSSTQVEARGFEPLTYSLQSYRSTN